MIAGRDSCASTPDGSGEVGVHGCMRCVEGQAGLGGVEGGVRHLGSCTTPRRARARASPQLSTPWADTHAKCEPSRADRQEQV
jgi:hypothetical protein